MQARTLLSMQMHLRTTLTCTHAQMHIHVRMDAAYCAFKFKQKHFALCISPMHTLLKKKDKGSPPPLQETLHPSHLTIAHSDLKHARIASHFTLSQCILCCNKTKKVPSASYTPFTVDTQSFKMQTKTFHTSCFLLCWIKKQKAGRTLPRKQHNVYFTHACSAEATQKTVKLSK